MSDIDSGIGKGELPIINMLSSADKVKGQGVGSAYLEQVSLVKGVLQDKVKVTINDMKYAPITHYHTIDLHFYFHALFGKKLTKRVGYVHFLPETVEGSIKLPAFAQKIFYKYMLEFYACMDELVTVNPVFVEKLVELGYDRDKITYIPNYVSSETFHKLHEEDILKYKESFGIPINKFVVLGVGQVQTRKGVMDFVEVAKSCPDICFVWAGGGSFGVITDGYLELKRLMENPPENVKFLGIVDREYMNGIYNMADVMFLPSYSELFPMTVLEAMSVGMPILLRDLELYEEILNGYYLKASDNQAFSDLIKKLSSDANFYREYCEYSKKGSQFYSRENVGAMWENYYKKLLE